MQVIGKCFSQIDSLREAWFVNMFFHEQCINVNQEYVKGCVCYSFASFFWNPNESTCENRKNGFYFTSKALFVLKKIKF